MKLSTINQVVQGIYDETQKRFDDAPTSTTAIAQRLANEAAVYLRTALICEEEGYDKAMDYFFEPHDDDEYIEWLTAIVKDKNDD